MAERFPVPTAKPEYRSGPAKFDAERWGVLRVLDAVSTGVAAALTLWYAALLALGVIRPHPAAVGYLLAFWTVLTYIALPRIHQLLTRIYVPGYFIGRTRTGDGLLGDPVNLALDGSATDIHAAMRRAGWTQADEITLASAWGIIKASLLRRSYPSAPVSDLFLFGYRQAFAYQQEVEGNPAQRHHVRFWKTPDGWLLPGGHRVEWLAAGTYDRAVGLSLFTGQVTHKIDANIDLERNYIIDTVRYADPECQISVLKDFSTSYHSVNGGGDRVHTDGDLPILDVGGAASRTSQELVLARPERERPPHRRRLAPISLWATLALSGVQALTMALLWLIIAVHGERVFSELDATPAYVWVVTGFQAAYLGFAIAAIRRRSWGLTGLRLTYAAGAAIELWGATTTQGQINAGTMSMLGLAVLVLWAISGQRAQNWVNPEPSERPAPRDLTPFPKPR